MSKPFEDAWAWLKTQVNSNALMLAVLGFVLAIGGAWARTALDELVDKKLEPIERKQARYEADVHEFAKDLRELYRVSPVIRRSERLERPFPTHGEDGGE